MRQSDGQWDDRFCGNRADRGGNPGYQFDQINWVCEGRTRCGNGVIQSGESCDDGNRANGDGCSDTCTIENGYSCIGAPSDCDMVCSARAFHISFWRQSL
ncbi:MAG: DUF4215 domain-containing protein [Sandaracinaceae bacterium]|nr:DUF4215 domain-containing protein [Sandaracinaceae bacterium]